MSTYDRRILDALGFDDDTPVSDGNVAAHLVNIAEGGGLAGIGLGWRDMEASTGFLVAIVNGVEESLDDLDAVDYHEVADSAIPIPTWTRVMAALELGLGGEDSELGGTSLDAVAAEVLYDYGQQLATALVDALTELTEGEDE